MTTWPLTQHLKAQLRQVLTTCLIGGVGLGTFAVIGGCGESSNPAEAAASASVSPLTNPDGKKVVRMAFVAQESGFDPVTAHDLYSSIIVDGIFDTLLTYDYLAEPAKLVPKILTEMPLIDDGGKRYTLKLKKGIFFSPHEAFGGKKRELTEIGRAHV